MFEFARTTKHLIRVSAILAIAVGASACSMLPDWVGTSNSEPSTAPDNATAEDQSGSQGPTVAEASDKYPVLADTPDKAPSATSTDEQKQVASGLVADRSQAQYSSEALRAGNETAAPPPPPSAEETSPPAESASPSGDDTEASATDDATSAASSSDAAATAAPARAPEPYSSSTLAGRAPMPGTLPPIEPSAATPEESSAAPPPHIAMAEPPPASASPTAASSAAGPTQTSAAAPAPPQPEQQHQQVAALTPPPAAAPSSSPSIDRKLAVYADPAGHIPEEVVFFPNDITSLTAEARAKIRAAAQAYRARGSRGYIRVIGHSSSRTPDMPLDKHMLRVFERSQERATAVAQELIKQGVPASKVLVEAVGDAQPVYAESMPQGEEGNRRAEIFIES